LHINPQHQSLDPSPPNKTIVVGPWSKLGCKK
jgi:hypothetical protein